MRVLLALAFLMLISMCSAGKIILKKPRVDYFDRRYMGWTCEGMDFPKMSGNPMKPDDLSDIVASDPRCGVFFAVDIPTFTLRCLPAVGPNAKTQCKPVSSPNSVLYILRRTDYDGMLPPLDQVGNTNGVAAGMGMGMGMGLGQMGVPSTVASSVDPTGFWAAAHMAEDGSEYFAQTFRTNPAALATALTTGGASAGITTMPGAEWEDAKQYLLYVQGIWTRDMDEGEKMKYAQWARALGQKVKPPNPQFMGTDNEQMAMMGFAQGVAADQAAAAAAATATDDTAAADTVVVDDAATADTAVPAAEPAVDTSVLSPSVSDAAMMANPYLFVDKDVDDIRLPMNAALGGAGAMGGMNPAMAMAMSDSDSVGGLYAGLTGLILRAYKRGEADQIRAHKTQLKKLQKAHVFGDDAKDMMVMNAAMGGAGMTGMTGMTSTYGMMGMGMTGLKPVNDVQTCLTAVQSALMCIGAEHEDAVQYQNICTFGANYVRMDKDVDASEVTRYMHCARMSQNVAMQTIFNGMAGIPAPAAATTATDAAADSTVSVSPAASPLPSTLNPMMLGGDDMGMDVESEDLMMMGGMTGMTNPTVANMAMMSEDGLDDNGLVASMMMQQAAAPAETAPAFVLRRARRYRGMTPTTMVGGIPYRLEDSEDYATAARIKSYLATLPAGSQLNLANGMIDTDIFDDMFEGGMLPQMVSQAAAAAGATTAASTTPTDTTATGGAAPCGSYKGLLPVDGIDQENMMMYPALVNDLVACFGPMAVNDGVNSDTVSMYAMRRGFAAPAAADAAPADPAATSRLMKPRFRRAQRGRTPQYRRRYW